MEAATRLRRGAYRLRRQVAPCRTVGMRRGKRSQERRAPSCDRRTNPTTRPTWLRRRQWPRAKPIHLAVTPVPATRVPCCTDCRRSQSWPSTRLSTTMVTWKPRCSLPDYCWPDQSIHQPINSLVSLVPNVTARSRHNTTTTTKN